MAREIKVAVVVGSLRKASSTDDGEGRDRGGAASIRRRSSEIGARPLNRARKPTSPRVRGLPRGNCGCEAGAFRDAGVQPLCARCSRTRSTWDHGPMERASGAETCRNHQRVAGALAAFGANHHLRQSLVFLTAGDAAPEATSGCGQLFDEAETDGHGTREFVQNSWRRSPRGRRRIRRSRA